jgi:hypothetical protein
LKEVLGLTSAGAGRRSHGKRGGENSMHSHLKFILFAAGLVALNFRPAFAQFGITPQPAQKMSSEKVLGTASGRYVFGQISDSSKDQFMLDTETGRLWRIGESSDVGTHLRAIPYKDEQGKVFFYPDAAPEQKPKEKPKK